jgi:hypothetical protein
MPLPSDTAVVLKAFRLGWYLAEVRGRNRPNPPDRDDSGLPGGDYRPLPLRIERTSTERRIEAQGVLAGLAKEFLVDDDGGGGSYGKRVDQDGYRLAAARKSPKTAPAALVVQWKELAEVLWDFDAHIQDVLTAASEIQACAYQLGRGLAETYWALDPFETGTAHGWAFLFGNRRCAELSRLVGRLSAYLNTYTGSAIVGSIEIWKVFAREAVFDKDQAAQELAARSAQDAVRDQVRRWYELIVLAQDPTTLIKPFDVLGNFRTVKQAVRQFWPQVAVTAIGLGCLAAVLILLGAGAGSGLLKTLGVILAATGLSIGGITGALKNSAQGLLVRLRQDTYTELVTEGVIVQPPSMSKATMRKAVAQRKLTPITPG